MNFVSSRQKTSKGTTHRGSFCLKPAPAPPRRLPGCAGPQQLRLLLVTARGAPRPRRRSGRVTTPRRRRQCRRSPPAAAAAAPAPWHAAAREMSEMEVINTHGAAASAVRETPAVGRQDKKRRRAPPRRPRRPPAAPAPRPGSGPPPCPRRRASGAPPDPPCPRSGTRLRPRDTRRLSSRASRARERTDRADRRSGMGGRAERGGLGGVEQRLHQERVGGRGEGGRRLRGGAARAEQEEGAGAVRLERLGRQAALLAGVALLRDVHSAQHTGRGGGMEKGLRPSALRGAPCDAWNARRGRKKTAVLRA